MQPGSKVRYVDAKGEEHAAVVGEVTGTGDSLYKIASLVIGTGENQVLVEKVVHENDAEQGKDGEPVGPYWREVGAARKREQPPLPESVPGGGVPSGRPVRVPDVESLRAQADEPEDRTKKKSSK